MSLLIDATTAEHARGGIGIVTDGLLGALAGLDLDGITVIAGPQLEVPGSIRAWRPPLIDRTPARILFQRVGLPMAAALANTGLGAPRRLLTMDSYVPAWQWPGSATQVECFVHDVLPLTHPQYFAARKDIAKRLAFQSIRKLRPRVFTSTPFTAAEIQRELGVDAEVVRFGCGQLSDAEAGALLSQPPSARGDYLLYVGALEERKDLRTLVAGFEMWRHATGNGTRLAIVGNWRTREGLAFRRWCEANGSASVRFLGRRPSHEVYELLLRAAALIYPSVAEGFGLPVLEGLAVGTPVITTAIPSITTWAGDCAFYFEPGDARSLVEALSSAIAAPIRVTSRRGKALAEQYRWRAFAERIAA